MVSWLPPEQYVRTLPSATMYAALFFTDCEGNPFALRSAQRAEAWQFPGGNVDHGDESPFATAVRECREETGIDFTKPSSLLLTHFLPPEPSWPCSKIGFVFDGGVLTPEELGNIVLDPAEHMEWRIQPLDAWKQIMSTRLFTRVKATYEARKTGSAGFLCEPSRLSA